MLKNIASSVSRAESVLAEIVFVSLAVYGTPHTVDCQDDDLDCPLNNVIDSVTHPYDEVRNPP